MPFRRFRRRIAFMSKMTADSSVEPIVAFLRVIDGIVEVRDRKSVV